MRSLASTCMATITAVEDLKCRLLALVTITGVVEKQRSAPLKCYIFIWYHIYFFKQAAFRDLVSTYLTIHHAMRQPDQERFAQECLLARGKSRLGGMNPLEAVVRKHTTLSNDLQRFLIGLIDLEGLD
jgi:hypothetical protein